MSWSARDWRQFIALTLLAAGNIPLTALLGWALWAVEHNPRNASALTLGLAIAGLIAADLLGVSAVLGRRTFRFKVGDAEIGASGEGAERLVARIEGGAQGGGHGVG